jgi:dephospho-CoA kinase
MEEKKKGRVVAITGGICSGKSTVMRVLEDEGASVISCDEEIKKIKSNPKILKTLIEKFSDIAKDNKKLAELVFSEPEKRKLLESILYPELDKAINLFIKSINKKTAFVEIPLLYEKGKENLYDKVILVKCSSDSQKQRAINRGISVLIFEKIVANQLPTEIKESKADYIIDTDTGFEKVRKQVIQIYKEIENEQSHFRP